MLFSPSHNWLIVALENLPFVCDANTRNEHNAAILWPKLLLSRMWRMLWRPAAWSFVLFQLFLLSSVPLHDSVTESSWNCRSFSRWSSAIRFSLSRRFAAAAVGKMEKSSKRRRLLLDFFFMLSSCKIREERTRRNCVCGTGTRWISLFLAWIFPFFRPFFWHYFSFSTAPMPERSSQLRCVHKNERTPPFFSPFFHHRHHYHEAEKQASARSSRGLI